MPTQTIPINRTVATTMATISSRVITTMTVKAATMTRAAIRMPARVRMSLKHSVISQ